ncbi:MAG: 16S rRNA processing protein RimM [Firmicutes bacterium]|nr:16S rRNA processing protein RimM [Bacillota bacterium]
MDDYVYVGKIVNTHGIRGEVRIISDFEYKTRVFTVGMPIYIGRKKELEKINSYRHHKNFEMITMDGYDNINQVLKYKGLYVYIKKEDLHLENGELLESDYIGLDVYVDDCLKGVIEEIRESGGNNKFFVVRTEKGNVFVPFQNEFIKNVDISKKRIDIKPITGMFL